MKKTLVALAALAASTAAFAQSAPASSVTLYGRLDGAVVNVDKANASNQSLTGVGDSTLASSIWGMRGSENLGGGMRGVFNVEGDVSVANGNFNAAGLFRRAANVGVAGGFGEVTAGLRMNPVIAAWASAQVMNSNSVSVVS
ncbi:MAG: porin, partial [Betaproteobacteria bacterium]